MIHPQYVGSFATEAVVSNDITVSGNDIVSVLLSRSTFVAYNSVNDRQGNGKVSMHIILKTRDRDQSIILLEMFILQ